MSGSGGVREASLERARVDGAPVDGALVDRALADLVERIGGQGRNGQARMARSVADAITDQRHLLVQAGTGTGKSFAYLVPAALASVSTGRRVLISTATLALQRQLISKDIPTVLDAVGHHLPRRPAVAVVKGRGNYLCRLRLEESSGPAAAVDGLFEIPSRLERQAEILREWARDTGSGDRDDMDQVVGLITIQDVLSAFLERDRPSGQARA